MKKKKRERKPGSREPKVEKTKVGDALIARRMAFVYKRAVKARCINIHPWPIDTPIEQTDVWPCFCRAARIAVDIKADPESYVRAQFEAWDGPSTVWPRPYQLTTTGAMYRYNVWLARQQRQIGNNNGRKEKRAGFPTERKKLARFVEHLGIDETEVLIQEAVEFSPAFLQHKGVWKQVADYWQSIAGEA